MSAKDLFYPKGYVFNEEEDLTFNREELIFNVTNDILLFMEDKNISQTNLASKLKTSRSYISRLLNGSANMTLGKLADISKALGFKVSVNIPVNRVTKQEYVNQKEISISEININNKTLITNDNIIPFTIISTKLVNKPEYKAS